MWRARHDESPAGGMTAMLGWARVSFRIQRWEVLAAAAGALLAVGGLLWLAWQLSSLAAAAPDCDFAMLGPGCEAISGPFLDLARLTNRAMAAAGLVPLGIGLILGVPIVAREVEQGTASIAWSLGRSRGSWLLRRLGFAAVVAIGLLVVVAIAAELLAAAALPAGSPSADFSWYGQRGELLLVRGLAALGIGLVLGAIIGRALAALLVAGLVALLAFGAFSIVMDRWLEAEAEIVTMHASVQWPSGYRYLDTRTLTPDGELLSWEEMQARGLRVQLIDEAGEQFASEADMRAGNSLGLDVQLLIPGERYREIVLRESAILGAVTFVLVVGAAAVVARRRPY
jgi:hypothetical protein